MSIAFLLLNVFVVLMLARLRFADTGLEYASPLPLSPQVWTIVLVSVAALAGTSAVVGRKSLADQKSRRALLELMLFPAGLGYLWWLLPAYSEDYRPIDFLAGVAFISVVALLFWLDRTNADRWGLTLTDFLSATRRLSAPTAVMIAMPWITGAFIGYEVQAERLAIALASYPLYAFLQLLVFQVFLIQRLLKITESRLSIVITAAGMFGLLHWPNGVLSVACLLSSAIWAWTYLRWPNLLALSLSMGLAAAMTIQVLPREAVLNNARCGPIYVQRLIDKHRQVLVDDWWEGLNQIK